MNPLEIQMDMTKKMYAEWEKNLGSYFDKTLRDQGFLKIVSDQISTSLDFQKEIQAQTSKMLQAFSIPTEESLEGLYKTVNNLEMRLMDVEARIADLTEELAVAKASQVAAPAPLTVPAENKPAIKEAKK